MTASRKSLFTNDRTLNKSKSKTHIFSSVVLRGRTFSIKELKIISALNKRYYALGRYRISIEVCKSLGWRQPNGWLKDRACRDVLRKLHDMRLIKLPASKRPPSRPSTHLKPQPSTASYTTKPITSLNGPIRLELAKGNSLEVLWNNLVQQHHYLGHKVTVGRCIKYLIYSRDDLLAAVSLADPAYAVHSRDCQLVALGIPRPLIANNSRFLILPNVRVPHLGSRILSLLATDGVQRWNTYYGIKLQCLETYVDPTRFLGTVYKAANWICVGNTKGYSKKGACHSNRNAPKMIFLYPLNQRIRHKLIKLVNR